MSISGCCNSGWRFVRALLVVALGPAAALAQAGRITGTVTDSAKAPMAGAQISVVGTRLGALTDAGGRFTIIRRRRRHVRGARAAHRRAGAVRRGRRRARQARIRASMSRSRARPSRSPASSCRRRAARRRSPTRRRRSRASAPTSLDNAVGNTFAGALKEAKGLDFIQVGMTTVAINARGFNSSFNNRLLMVEDGRISVLPENGLPVGQFTPTPKVDLAGMEVLVGPGSALYGPDASNGVLSLRTKDPRAVQGRDARGDGRQPQLPRRPGSLREHVRQLRLQGRRRVPDGERLGELPLLQRGRRDRRRPVARRRLHGERAATSRIRSTGTRASFAAPARSCTTRGEQPPRAQRRHEPDRRRRPDERRPQPARATGTTTCCRRATRRRTGTSTRTASQSQSGTSFALNRYAGAQLTPANATLTRRLAAHAVSDWPSDGRMYAAEVQGNYTLPMLLNTSLVFGAQYRNDVVSSDRQWLTTASPART